MIDTTTHLQTSGGGDLAHFYGTDSKHIVQSTYHRKTNSGPTPVRDSGVTIPFAFGQRFHFSTGGSLKDTRDYAVFSVTGWVEP